MTAPERISISPTYNQKRDDDYYLVDRDAFPGKGTEYIRADILQAAIAAAYEAAATEIKRKQMDRNSDEWESKWESGNNSAVIGCAATIRALTPADALAALEAVKREAFNEGVRSAFAEHAKEPTDV